MFNVETNWSNAMQKNVTFSSQKKLYLETNWTWDELDLDMT